MCGKWLWNLRSLYMMLWLMWFAFSRCFSVLALFSGWASISCALTLGSLMPLALLAQLLKSGREGHLIWSMVYTVSGLCVVPFSVSQVVARHRIRWTIMECLMMDR
jgi:hypothetical protein